MSHKSIARTKRAIKRARYDVAELRALMIFIAALLKSAGVRPAHAGHRKGRHTARRKGHRHLRAGIHHVRIGKHMRKVHVLANGRWRFMKG